MTNVLDVFCNCYNYDSIY